MKILIADDDPTTRAVLKVTLMGLGYDVVEASNGTQAWSILVGPEAPQLAILDWQMPGRSGLEICRDLRVRSDGPYVYAILLTSMDGANDIVTGLEAGADDYITKPFRTAELTARLRAGRRILDLEHVLLDAQQALEVRATHDGLTGLLNHAAILDRLMKELERAKREQSRLAVLLIDLDHFKQVNDVYGHSVGDQVLREVARRMVSVIRPYDVVGRYGGEEFLLVAPGCDRQGALVIAERLRQSVGGSPVLIRAGQICVTASIGIGGAEPNFIVKSSDLVDSADRALYAAKNSGRNRIVCADGVAPAFDHQLEFKMPQ